MLLLFRPFFTGRGGTSINADEQRQFRSYPVSIVPILQFCHQILYVLLWFVHVHTKATDLLIVACNLLFVSVLAKRLAGKTTTLMISFMTKGFPYKDQVEEYWFYFAYYEHVTFSTCPSISVF